MVLPVPAAVKQAISQHWRGLVALAAALDIAIIVTAIMTGHLIGAFPVMFARWVVMGLGILSVQWADHRDGITQPARGLATGYLILGFTATAGVAGYLAGRI